MRKFLLFPVLLGMIFINSCSKSGGKVEKLTDPQIDAKIGVVRDHVSYVSGYAVSPDGKTVVTVGSYDYIFWNADNGTEIKAFRPERYNSDYRSFVNAKYTPDGKIVVLTSYNGVKIIDAQQLKELKTLHFDNFNGEAFDISKDGKFLVVGDGKMLKVVDLASFEVVKSFGESENRYTDVAFLDDSQFVTLEYNGQEMYLWDLNEAKDVMTFSVSENAEFLATSTDGKYIAVYDDDLRNVTVFNSATSAEKNIETGYAGEITFMNDKLVTLTSININIFDIESGEKQKSFDLGGTCLKYDAAGNLLYYIDGSLRAVNPDNGEIVNSFGNDAQGVFGVLPSASGRFLVLEIDHKYSSGGYNLLSMPVDTTAQSNLYKTASSSFGIAAYVGNSDKLAAVVTSGDISVYDLTSGNVVKEYNDFANDPLVFTPDGKKLIAKDYSQTYHYNLYDFETKEKIAELTNSSAYVQYAGTTPDGKYYVLSDNDRAFVYDLEENKSLEENKKLYDTRLVDMLNDKYVAVTAGIDELSIVDLLSGDVILSFDDVNATRIAISPDKNYMAIAPKDDFGVFLYDFVDDQWKPVLYGHTYFPSSVAFTPDSKYLISTSKDNQTIIWDVATGKKVLTIIAYDLTKGNKPATKDYIVFAPNGRYDGTPEAIKRFLYFEKDGKRLPASDYKDKCYTPNLLGKTLGQNFTSL